MDLNRDLIIKQLSEECCPICSLLGKYEFNLMANLQWDVGEQGNLEVEKIIREQGFCNYHFHMLFKMSNPQHLSKFLIRYINDFIRSKLAQPELWERKCSVCDLIDNRTQELILGFSQIYQSEAMFREKFQKNRLLCLPHLQQIMATNISQNFKDELLSHHKEVLNVFGTIMSSFVNKRYTEAEGEERQSPLLVIQLMVGFHGTRWSK